MRITRKQLRSIIKEAIAQESVKSFSIPYNRFGYKGRQIISRDRSWLEFVPRGTGSKTQDDMFRAVTLLEPGDPEIEKALVKDGSPEIMDSIDGYDVYLVYATTTG